VPDQPPGRQVKLHDRLGKEAEDSYARRRNPTEDATGTAKSHTRGRSENMCDELWKDLESLEPRQQILALRALQEDMANGHTGMTSEQLRLLSKVIITADENLDVWQAGINTYFASLARDYRHGKTMPEQRSLDDWFWEPFRHPSVVVRAFDPHRHRDEDAVIELSAHLSKPRYPHVEHLRIDLENPLWGEVVHPKKVDAICVVGRPGMYGADVLSTVDSPEGKELEFYFPVQTRPKDLELGSLDRGFHQICRRLPDGNDGDRCVSESDGKERIDYGLVQRYAVTYNTRLIVVVICRLFNPGNDGRRAMGHEPGARTHWPN